MATARAVTPRRPIPGFSGRVVGPTHPSYPEVRAIWNGQVERRPALIAVCADAADVAAAVRFARASGLDVSVRGGGHNVAGHSLADGGIVIDLSQMRRVTLDHASGRVRVQGGARLGDVDHVVVPADRVVPSGIVTDTGVGGLTLGGGIGWTMRRFGLTCDSLEAVELVTSDGRRLQADERSHPELLWGLRGGGGNFGVVTEMTFRSHAFSPTVAAGFVVYRLDDTGVLEGLAQYAAQSPPEVTTITFLRLAPPLPWMPGDVVGTPVVMVGAVGVGPVPRAMAAVAPLSRLGDPLVDTIAPRPFLDHQAAIDAANPAGHRYYWTSRYVDGLGPRLRDRLLGHARDLSSPGSLIAVFQLGAAVREGGDRSCAPSRDASFLVTYGSHWTDPAEDDVHRAWTRAACRQIASDGSGGGYTNFEGDDAVPPASLFPSATMRRLVALKGLWDPDNVFRHNVNIPPRPQR